MDAQANISAADDIVIPHRYRGGSTAANGGYAAGVLAERLSSDVRIRFRLPVPLDVALTLKSVSGGLHVMAGEDWVAEAYAERLDLALPAPPSCAEVEAGQAHYRSSGEQGFAHCFVCGPERQAGDGLRIFTAQLESGRIAAAPWRPDPAFAGEDGYLAKRFVWGALDCPAAVAAWFLDERMMLTGELHGAVVGRVRAGEKHICVAWPIKAEGRKISAGSAVYSADGTLKAFARSIWIVLRDQPG